MILSKEIPKNELDFKNPKEFLQELVHTHGKRELKRYLRKNSNGSFENLQDWNRSLQDFVMEKWDPQNAKKFPKSLDRMLKKLS